MVKDGFTHLDVVAVHSNVAIHPCLDYAISNSRSIVLDMGLDTDPLIPRNDAAIQIHSVQ